MFRVEELRVKQECEINIWMKLNPLLCWLLGQELKVWGFKSCISLCLGLKIKVLG